MAGAEVNTAGGEIDAAVAGKAEGALVWLTRHPSTRNWMEGMDRVRLEPLLLRCRSFHGACNLGKDGYGWAMGEMQVRDGTSDKETGVAIGDGTA